MYVLFKEFFFSFVHFRNFSWCGIGPLPHFNQGYVICIHIAVACPMGLFKELVGDVSCSPCPANSNAPGVASTSCTCDEGYQRSNGAPLSNDCSGMEALNNSASCLTH